MENLALGLLSNLFSGTPAEIDGLSIQSRNTGKP
jgi:hypothetical protein